MSSDEFRRHAHALVDWIASYWDRLQAHDPSLPVLSRVKPGEVAARLPGSAPEQGEPWHDIFADVERIIMPGITHWQSPGFFGFFPANTSAPSVLGDLLSAGLTVQGMLWTTSPAVTELETRVLDWMARAIGLPAEFLSVSSTRADGVERRGGGVIEGTASEAVLVAMLAARARHADRRAGRMVVYASSQAHSSVVKAAMIAGFADGPEDRVGMRLIGTDEAFRMDVGALEQAIQEDVAAGRIPVMVCATVGTTSSTAVDPVRAIGEVCRRHGVWLHVDAAYAGSAAICEEFRWVVEGAELADSWGFNPHKWLLTNFDCGLFWTRDRASLLRALSITPEYLRNAASDAGAVIDYRDWQIPLGRRFRALKLWFVMRHYGLEGLRAHIRGHVRLAEHFESLVRSDDRFEIAAPRTLSLVCFRLKGDDARSKRLLEWVNASGRVYMTHTVLPAPRAGFVLRMAIGGTFTRREDIDAAWTLLRAGADAIS